ncbi:MAG: hypothetical protein Q9191_005661 [Dirinaria sp. TL-2023a]
MEILLTAVFGWYNIITDFILFLLPMPMLWKMHLSWRKKGGLAFVFATGGLVCAISIIRQVIFYNNSANGAQETDGTWTEITNYVWFSLELNLGIFCGCLPILHPLLRRIPALKDYLPVSLRSLFSTHSVMSKSNRSKKSTTQGKNDIELAEEGRVIGKKASQNSGDDTLYDPNDNHLPWEGGILRTDQFAIQSHELGEDEKLRLPQTKSEAAIYQG